MDTTEVVPHEVESYGVGMIFDLLRERIGEPSEAAHRHAHGEVLAFHE